jgi:hypothetical protein
MYKHPFLPSLLHIACTVSCSKSNKKDSEKNNAVPFYSITPTAAQELKEVYPEFVKQNGNGFYSVQYQMIPLLVQGIKEQ